MATELKYATENSSLDNSWTLGAGSTKWEAVLTNDGDTSYITAPGTTQVYQGFKKEDSDLLATDTINWVKIHAFMYVDKTNKKGQIRYRSGSSTSDSAQFDVTKDSYGQHTYDMGATNPITALPWTLDDIDGTNRFEMAVTNTTARSDYRCTQIWVEVDYTPLSAGVGRLVNGGLVNAGLVGGRLVK